MAKTLDEQYKAIQVAVLYFKQESINVTRKNLGIHTQVQENIEALLDAAETIKRVQTFADFAVENFKQ